MTCGWRGSSAVDDIVGGGAWPDSASCAAVRWRVNFSARLKIGVCWHMERNFSTRFPPEARSTRDTPVGVLIGRNEGDRKKLLATRCSDGGFGFCEAFVTTVKQPECGTIIGWVAGIDHTAKP